jgi:hypothetical protein
MPLTSLPNTLALKKNDCSNTNARKAVMTGIICTFKNNGFCAEPVQVVDLIVPDVIIFQTTHRTFV